ncbi:hypothetical protein MASR2M15_16870 [Anaerolineales bacterium]
MKLLFVVSSLDLKEAFSATPAWWQLLKGLYEIGVDIIATPYQGPAIETLWWHSEDNPAKWQGDLFKSVRDLGRKFGTSAPVQMQDTQADLTRTEKNLESETRMDKFVRQSAQTLIAPIWKRHLDRILTKNPDIDAVIFLTVPLNHLNGVPAYIQSQHHKPVFYFDGDVPASLPNMKGFASGFRIYQGAQLNEYTAFISNSQGGENLLQQLGVKNTHTLWYGADPDVFSPIPVADKDLDVMFYGHGREYRAEWIDAMIAQPARLMPDTKFAVRGTALGDLGPTQLLPYLSFSKLREYACRSKINLCITRGAHASIYASSSSRPFELSAMGAAIVANPYLGLEEWFEPDKEIIIINDSAEAIERYQWLLTHDQEREAIGQRARQRVLKQHTFQHRARELRQIIQTYLS